MDAKVEMMLFTQADAPSQALEDFLVISVEHPDVIRRRHV